MAFTFKKNAKSNAKSEATAEPKSSQAPSAQDFINSLVTAPEEAKEFVDKLQKDNSRFDGSALWKGEYLPKKDALNRFILRRGPKGALAGVVAIHYIERPPKDGIHRSDRFICTDPRGEGGEGTCAFCDAGYRRVPMYVYDVIDLVGRKDKSGATVGVGESRYLLLNDKRRAILESFIRTAEEDAFNYAIRLTVVRQNDAKATTEYVYDKDKSYRVTDKDLVAQKAIEKLIQYGKLTYEEQEKIAESAAPYRKAR